MTHETATSDQTATSAAESVGGVKVLYLIGWGRSGSTLIDTLLGEIPGFFSTGELRNIWKEGLQEGRTCGCGRPVRECDVWGRVLDRARINGVDAAAMAHVQQDALRTRHAWHLIRSLHRGRALPPAVARYAATQGRIYDAIAHVTGARVVVDSSKVPANAALLGSMPEVEPYLLHLVRDPRASAYSWQREKDRLDGDTADRLPRFGLAQSSLNWLAFNGAAELLRRHEVFRYSLVRYEDFVADPRSTIASIVRFVGETPGGLPFEDRSVGRLHGNHTVSGNPGRFRTGRVEIRDDDEWRRQQPRAHHVAVTTVTVPMLWRYRYLAEVPNDGGLERRALSVPEARRGKANGRAAAQARPSTRGTLEPMALGELPPEPLVSILVTNHNYERFIGDALESVMRQTYDRWELVVCDDGSTDRSIEVIERYTRLDDRVRLVAKSNGGQASAFNAAYSASCGDVICFLDADDVFLGDKVASVVRAFRGTRAGLLVHQLMIVDQTGKDVQRIPTFTRFEDGWIADRIVERGGRWRWMPTSGIALRRELAEKIFPVPEDPFRIDADMFMLELAPLLTSIATIDEVLARYRLHETNAFSRRGMDRSNVERTIASITTALEQVNGKLRDLGLAHAQLDPSRNLTVLERRFLMDAFDGATSRSDLAPSYARLAAAIVRDDLYTAPQKGWALLLYLGVLALPVHRREAWASASLGISHGKELLRRIQQIEILGRGRRTLRRATR